MSKTDTSQFTKKHIRVDLGFMGITKDCRCKKVSIPNKGAKNRTLSTAGKDENMRLAKTRIYVEHSIVGLKRYRILSDRLRLRDIGLYNDALEVFAGLWNFYVTH